MNKYSEMIAMLMMILFFTVSIGGYKFTQRYTLDGANTATKGLVFTTTIDLSKYNQIGSGKGLFGSYDLVTRSLTQGNSQTLRIYK